MPPASTKRGWKIELGANWDVIVAGLNKFGLLVDRNVKPVQLGEPEEKIRSIANSPCSIAL